jgi:Diguanylate cyclase, GGDEF domain
MKEPSWLGLVDIDKFKCINDNYGHLFGDEVLLLVSQLMKKSFRGTDQLFRFGGEEFVIVLDHATTEGVEVAFDRLRETIAAFEFPQVGRVTISLGYKFILRTARVLAWSALTPRSITRSIMVATTFAPMSCSSLPANCRPRMAEKMSSSFSSSPCAADCAHSKLPFRRQVPV